VIDVCQAKLASAWASNLDPMNKIRRSIPTLRRQLAFPSQRQLERPREGHASRVCCFV